MRKLHPRSRLHLPKLRRQDGFTLILALLVLLITALMLVAAFTAANGEIHLTSTDTAQKKAFYAAEAGLEDYEYQLTQDGNYLTYCTTPPAANPALNQYYKEGVGVAREGPEPFVPLKASELSTAEVTGTSGEEKYALQLIPAKSDEKPEDSAEPGWKKVPHCDKNRVVASMVEEQEGAASGTFQIESTGFSGKEQRTLVATFRNANFVSYVWYSVYETGDPSLYGTVPAGKPENYYSECGKFYTEREALPEKQCRPFNNFFISGETVNGPMHTEDHEGVCGDPVLGRNKNDRIEFGNGGEKKAKVGYSNEGECGAAEPEFKGTQVEPENVKQITPPPGDEELEHVVETSPTDYKYEGQTEIVLKGSTMTVIEHKGASNQTTTTGVAFPPNGVIYVSGVIGGTCETYSPFGPHPGYTEGSACGNVYVQGEYSKALTIAAQNDVIINGNVFPSSVTTLGNEPTGNAMLGLIANNFVRVYHPVNKTYTKTAGSKCKEEAYVSSDDVSHKILDKELSSTECEYTNEVHHYENTKKEWEVVDACDATNDTVNTPGIPEDLKNPYIYAGILALKHAFIVDNFDCGTPTLKSLNVYGAVAGEFSNGMTGVFSGTTPLTGYPYNLKYDNRLQAAEPPHFLNPIQAAWYIQRQTLAGNP
jgi:type II secretory pathway pseudopilin PulG